MYSKLIQSRTVLGLKTLTCVWSNRGYPETDSGHEHVTLWASRITSSSGGGGYCQWVWRSLKWLSDWWCCRDNDMDSGYGKGRCDELVGLLWASRLQEKHHLTVWSRDEICRWDLVFEREKAPIWFDQREWGVFPCLSIKLLQSVSLPLLQFVRSYMHLQQTPCSAEVEPPHPRCTAGWLKQQIGLIHRLRGCSAPQDRYGTQTTQRCDAML